MPFSGVFLCENVTLKWDVTEIYSSGLFFVSRGHQLFARQNTNSQVEKFVRELLYPLNLKIGFYSISFNDLNCTF